MATITRRAAFKSQARRRIQLDSAFCHLLLRERRRPFVTADRVVSDHHDRGKSSRDDIFVIIHRAVENGPVIRLDMDHIPVHAGRLVDVRVRISNRADPRARRDNPLGDVSDLIEHQDFIESRWIECHIPISGQHRFGWWGLANRDPTWSEGAR